MSEKLEDFVRKSLDDVERRRKRLLILGIIMIVIAGFYGFIMAMYVDIWQQNLPYEVMFGFDAVIIWTGGLAVLILSKSYSSTRMILKAIETLSNKKSE